MICLFQWYKALPFWWTSFFPVFKSYLNFLNGRLFFPVKDIKCLAVQEMKTAWRVHLGVFLMEGFVSSAKLQNKHVGNFERMKIPQYVTQLEYKKQEYTRRLLLSVKDLMMRNITWIIFTCCRKHIFFLKCSFKRVCFLICSFVLQRMWISVLVNYLHCYWLYEVHVQFENWRLFNNSII